MARQKLKISFCIVCMNRLHQLKETLLRNILDNADYSDLEFILLDYNSGDGMGEWVKENLHEFLANGKVIYYHTAEPLVFSHSHSKNIAFKLATGEILCNINADHYTGPGFATYIDTLFAADDNIVLTTVDYYKTNKNYHPPKDVFGRVCVRRSDFLQIKGFDERMNGYGFEDWDLINRLEMIGKRRVFIEDFSFLGFISHEDQERYALATDNLKGIFINYREPAVSEIIFLYRTKQFEKGVLIDNSTIDAHDYKYAYEIRGHRFEYMVKEPGWLRGTYNDNDRRSIDLTTDFGSTFSYELRMISGIEVLSCKNQSAVFYPINNEDIIDGLLRFNYFFYNRSIMEKNIKEVVSITNPGNFGHAHLTKNFQTPLSV